jgi:hypothetical protein
MGDDARILLFGRAEGAGAMALGFTHLLRPRHNPLREISAAVTESRALFITMRIKWITSTSLDYSWLAQWHNADGIWDRIR